MSETPAEQRLRAVQTMSDRADLPQALSLGDEAALGLGREALALWGAYLDAEAASNVAGCVAQETAARALLARARSVR